MAKTTKPQPGGLRLRKHADKSGDRTSHGGWPLAGVSIEGDPPNTCIVSTSLVTAGKTEGWLATEGDRVVTRPGGEPGNEWRIDKVHNFLHLDAVIFKTRDGDVRYQVIHQPDKYVEGDAPGEEVTDEHYAAGNTRVDHFYRLELEG
jgi:hypothetical protein